MKEKRKVKKNSNKKLVFLYKWFLWNWIVFQKKNLLNGESFTMNTWSEKNKNKWKRSA